MTTVLDANVHNLTVEGSFDDCQDIVKALFADKDLNSTHNIGAINRSVFDLHQIIRSDANPLIASTGPVFWRR